MSIRPLIDNAIGRRLEVWEPFSPGTHTRVIYMEAAFHNEVINADPRDFRMGALWSDLDKFSLGGLITIGYGAETTCIMKKLDPPDDEIWEIRSKDPQPQVRIFGRFCAPDEFLATHAVYRDHLGDPRDGKFGGNHWPQEIIRCRQIWDQILQGHPPHTGNDINDYIKSNVVEIHKLP